MVVGTPAVGAAAAAAAVEASPSATSEVSSWSVGLDDIPVGFLPVSPRSHPTSHGLRDLLWDWRRHLDACDARQFVAGQLRRERLVKVIRERASPGDVEDILAELPHFPVSCDQLGPQEELLHGLQELRSSSGGRLQPSAAAEVWAAVSVGAIAACPLSQLTSLSPLFVVQQTEKLRLIFDLRRLNSCFDDAGFKMETLLDLPRFVRPSHTCASKIDLRKAYWQVPVDGSLSRMLGCRLPDGSFGRWTVLPFGLSHAPRLFAGITTSLVRAWRSAGLHVFAYLDDILVLADSAEEHGRAVAKVLGDLRAAGIIVSSKKAFLLPYRTLEFLGLLVDIPARAFALPAAKLGRIREEARALLGSGGSVHDVEALIGRMAFAALAVPFARYFYTHLTAALSEAVAAARDRVQLNAGAVAELEWWLSGDAHYLADRWWPWHQAHARVRIAERDAPGQRGRPHVTASCDASETGVGWTPPDSAVVLDEPLPADLLGASSTTRELYGMCRTVETGRFREGQAVRLLCDNAAAVATAAGRSATVGTVAMARRLWRAAMAAGVTIVPEWLSRDELHDVDAGSRRSEGSLTYAKVSAAECRRLWSDAWGDASPVPLFELFACEADRVAPGAAFASRFRTPGSVGEAMSLDWSTVRRGWAYPPFALVRACLARIAAMSDTPDIVWLLPDSRSLRECLAGRYRFVAGPEKVLAPPEYTRVACLPAGVKLVACVPV